MEAYKIYDYQRDVLIQQVKRDGSRYNPVTDVNGDYFISKREYEECGLGTLSEFIAPEAIV